MNAFDVTFLGTGGSVAYNNGKRAKYGANSVCVQVVAGETVLVFDTGTGVCGLSADSPHTHIFYSHYHLDHLCGFIFTPGLFDKSKKFDFYGMGDVKKVLENLCVPSFCPVNLEMFGADLRFNSVAAGVVFELPGDVTVKTCALSHPNGAIGYRVEYKGKSFVYCLDSELSNHAEDKNLHEFTENADLLVMDSFFDDGRVIPGWGHSSWKECALWAKKVNAKRLALCHHDMKKTDEEISAFEEKAKAIFPQTFAVADYGVLSI